MLAFCCDLYYASTLYGSLFLNKEFPLALSIFSTKRRKEGGKEKVMEESKEGRNTENSYMFSHLFIKI